MAKKKAAQNVMIASNCTGGFLLAETELLNHKTATTHWMFTEQFRKRYPLVDFKPESMITDENQFYCSGGSTTFFDLSLYLTEKFMGHEVAAQCSKILLLDPVRSSQTPYCSLNFQKHHQDSSILNAQQWLEKHYREDFMIDSVAKQFNMSIRNFKRRFKKVTGDTPLKYLQRVRIEAAKRDLRNIQKSVEEIGCGVGYEDAGFFRKVFKRYTNLTPSLYRQKFCIPNSSINIKA